MIIIELKEARFFAFHGLYEEEQRIGNEFEINLAVLYKMRQKKIKKIDDTIDYVKLYELVAEEMKTPRKLLETLAIEIVEKIKAEFLQVKEVEIGIRKLDPPFVNFRGSVAVTYRKRF